MRQCHVCRSVNQDEAARCRACGSEHLIDLLPLGFPPPLPPALPFIEPSAPSRGMDRFSVRLGACCGLLLVVVIAFNSWTLAALGRGLEKIRREARVQHEDETRLEKQARKVESDAIEAGHQMHLRNPDYLSGALALKNHEDEWTLRLAHDPKAALTVAEKSLVRMERVGGDPSVQAKIALEEVTRLAAPTGSRVEVSPMGGGFSVRVAFRMSALAKNEAGAVTKHHNTLTMRREIEDLSAQVMKDLFDYCGSRGIEKLSVSCNHALQTPFVPLGATSLEKDLLSSRARPVMGNLYRVSLDRTKARAVADWRRISNPQVIALTSVEHDGLWNLTIHGRPSSPSEQRDPEGELEF